MGAGDANCRVGCRGVLQVFSIAETGEYLCRIRMRNINAAQHKRHSEQKTPRSLRLPAAGLIKIALTAARESVIPDANDVLVFSIDQVRLSTD
jgi:hypothetical protein